MRVLLDLVQGRVEPVLERFDERMKEALSETRLRETLDRVGGLVGAYRGIGEPFAHRAGDLTVVRVPLRFEAGEMTGQVTFDRAGRIAGLFITRPRPSRRSPHAPCTDHRPRPRRPAAVTGLALRRSPARDTLPGKLVSPVLVVAGLVAALTGAIVPGLVLLAAGGAVGVQAMTAR